MSGAMGGLLALGRLQAQVVTRQQAEGLGVGRNVQQRMVELGQWRRLARGILLLHGGEPAFTSRCWAGLLLGGESSMVAGDAAAHLWKLRGEPQLVEVLLPHHARARDQGSWHFRRACTLPAARGAIRRTPVEETVLDLCQQMPDEMESLVADACRQLTSRRRLRRALSGRARFPRRAELAQLLSDDEAGIESALERLYLRRVERAHGLPSSVRQVWGRQTRRDLVYQYGLVVELDGRRGHEGSGAFRDMRRDNDTTVLGLRTLRYGWTDCSHHPCQVAAQVGVVLQGLGWVGVPTSCSHCS